MNSVPTKNENTVSRVVDGETVIVEPQKGMVNVVSEVATRIWELIDGTRSIEQISNIISDEYEVSMEQAASDAKEFVEELKSHDLVSLM